MVTAEDMARPYGVDISAVGPGSRWKQAADAGRFRSVTVVELSRKSGPGGSRYI